MKQLRKLRGRSRCWRMKENPVDRRPTECDKDHGCASIKQPQERQPGDGLFNSYDWIGWPLSKVRKRRIILIVRRKMNLQNLISSYAALDWNQTSSRSDFHKGSSLQKIRGKWVITCTCVVPIRLSKWWALKARRVGAVDERECLTTEPISQYGGSLRVSQSCVNWFIL
jgi:hypothetical protein